MRVEFNKVVAAVKSGARVKCGTPTKRAVRVGSRGHYKTKTVRGKNATTGSIVCWIGAPAKRTKRPTKH